MKTWITVALALLVPSACTDRPDVSAETRSFITRDSAGIEIVESSAPRFAAGSWRLSQEPLETCSASGPSGDQRIFQVQSVLPLANDRLAIPVRGTREVLICDGGAIIGAVGGDGEGPGELRFLYGMVPAPGDSVAVLTTGKTTLFDLGTGGFRDIPHHQLLDGTAARVEDAVTAFVAVRPLGADAGPESSGPADLVYLDWDGNAARVLNGVPVRPGTPITMSGFVWGTARATFATDGYWLPSAEALELTRFGASGPDRIIRAVWDPIPVTEAIKQEGKAIAMRQLESSNPDTPGSLFASMVDSWVANDTTTVVAAVVSVRPTADGELWVRVPEADPGEDPHRWRIFGADGTWLAEMAIPRAVRPVWVTPDRLYGVRSDELGLESVEVYLIERGR